MYRIEAKKERKKEGGRDRKQQGKKYTNHFGGQKESFAKWNTHTHTEQREKERKKKWNRFDLICMIVLFLVRLFVSVGSCGCYAVFG